MSSDQVQSNMSCFVLLFSTFMPLDEKEILVCYVYGSVRYQRTSDNRLMTLHVFEFVFNNLLLFV